MLIHYKKGAHILNIEKRLLQKVKPRLITQLEAVTNYKDTVLNTKNNPNVIFMFSGQGAQYVNMSLGLYKKAEFYRTTLDQCLELIEKQSGEDFKAILFSEAVDTKINNTYYTQTLLFALEYSLAKYIMHLGVQPNAMIGHSIGEYAAACLSGVFSLEDTIQIVLKRGALMQSAEKGAMLSVSHNLEAIQDSIPSNLSIATINTEDSFVVSGKEDDIKTFSETLKTKAITSVILKTSHAFHSFMMDAIVGDFKAYLSNFEMNAPSIPFISNYTGTWITNEQATSATYWGKPFKAYCKVCRRYKNNT